MRRSLNLYDETRIDHFRGLAGYWAVPGTSTSAKTGSRKVREETITTPPIGPSLEYTHASRI
eukprot:448460-Prorocentrum_minimum.AAC.2